MLLYSKCLKTLDLVESFLQSKKWARKVTSLDQHFPSAKLGGWKKGSHYLRIDGSVDSGKRGSLVRSFGNSDSVEVFLISSLAGGLGINLVGHHCTCFCLCCSFGMCNLLNLPINHLDRPQRQEL